MIHPQDEDYRPSPFTEVRLITRSFYALLGNLAEFQVIVDEEGIAHILGDGYNDETTLRFTSLILDWEASLSPEACPELTPGTYALRRDEEGIYLPLNDEKVRWVDGAATVVLRPLPNPSPGGEGLSDH